MWNPHVFSVLGCKLSNPIIQNPKPSHGLLDCLCFGFSQRLLGSAIQQTRTHLAEAVRAYNDADSMTPQYASTIFLHVDVTWSLSENLPSVEQTLLLPLLSSILKFSCPLSHQTLMAHRNSGLLTWKCALRLNVAGRVLNKDPLIPDVRPFQFVYPTVIVSYPETLRNLPRKSLSWLCKWAMDLLQDWNKPYKRD